jgi:hypothetical protein
LQYLGYTSTIISTNANNQSDYSDFSIELWPLFDYCRCLPN